MLHAHQYAEQGGNACLRTLAVAPSQAGLSRVDIVEAGVTRKRDVGGHTVARTCAAHNPVAVVNGVAGVACAAEDPAGLGQGAVEARGAHARVARAVRVGHAVAVHRCTIRWGFVGGGENGGVSVRERQAALNTSSTPRFHE